MGVAVELTCSQTPRMRDFDFGHQPRVEALRPSVRLRSAACHTSGLPIAAHPEGYYIPRQIRLKLSGAGGVANVCQVRFGVGR